MWRRRLAALVTATAAGTGLVTATAPVVLADTGTAVEAAANRLTFALIGDTPYGDIQRAQFSALVAAINADPKARMVLHAGDVKNGPVVTSGSPTCGHFSTRSTTRSF